jgi:hypothetical protein
VFFECTETDFYCVLSCVFLSFVFFSVQRADTLRLFQRNTNSEPADPNMHVMPAPPSNMSQEDMHSIPALTAEEPELDTPSDAGNPVSTNDDRKVNRSSSGAGVMDPRTTLAMLFKLIHTMSEQSIITPTQKGYLKDLVIQYDAGLMQAAVMYAATKNIDGFSSAIFRALKQAHASGDIEEAPHMAAFPLDSERTQAPVHAHQKHVEHGRSYMKQYLALARQLFDSADVDGEGLVSVGRIQAALDSSKLGAQANIDALVSHLHEQNTSITFDAFLRCCFEYELEFV